MIRLGTQKGFSACLGLSPGETYALMAKEGFSSVDFTLMHDYTSEIWRMSDPELKEYMTAQRKIINDNGIIVGQTHSPMDALWIDSPETKEKRLHAQIQAIKAASWLGSPYTVIHPLMPKFRRYKEGIQETKKLNMEFFSFLRPYLEEYNVKAAIENSYIFDDVRGRMCECTCSTAEELIDYCDSLNNERFVVCLDVGHAVLGAQDPVDMIYKLGKKYLHVTHIHDNDLLTDNHTMPGLGKLNWHAIGKALNDIGYEDIFNYEADIPYYHLASITRDPQIHRDLFHCYAEFGKAIVSVK